MIGFVSSSAYSQDSSEIGGLFEDQVTMYANFGTSFDGKGNIPSIEMEPIGSLAKPRARNSEYLL